MRGHNVCFCGISFFLLLSLLAVSEIQLLQLQFGVHANTNVCIVQINKCIYKLQQLYHDPNEMSGRSYLCICPQTILLSEKENRICTLLTHR